MKKALSVFMAGALLSGVFTMGVVPASAESTPVATMGAATIDGAYSEWDSCPQYDLGVVQEGSGDTSGWFKMMWDGDAIYMLVEVSDSTQAATGSDWMQIAFDFDGKASSATAITDRANAGVYSFNLDPWLPGGFENPALFDNISGSQSAANCGYDVIGRTDVNGAIDLKKGDGKYIAELKFVPANDTLKAKLTKGSVLGLEVKFFDNAGKVIGWADNNKVAGDDMSKIGSMTLVNSLFEKQTATAEKGTPKVDLKEDIIWKKVASQPITIVYENAGWGLGQTDTVGSFKTLWDEKGLYFWIEVTDDTPNVPGDVDYYKRDSVDIFIEQLNNDVLETTKLMGSFDEAGYFSITGLGDYSNPQGGMSSSTTKLMGTETDTGYVYEGFVKWTKSNVAAVNTVIGFDVQINDNITGTTRGAIVNWSDDDGLAFHQVNKYGDITLVDSNLMPEPTVQTATAGIPALKDATDLDTQEVTLNWNALANTSAYQVNVYKVVGDKDYRFSQNKEVTGDKNTVTFDGLESNTGYVYQIVSYDDSGTVIGVYQLGSFTTVKEGTDTTATTGATTAASTTTTGKSTTGTSPSTGEAGASVAFALLTAGAVLTLIAKNKKKNG